MDDHERIGAGRTAEVLAWRRLDQLNRNSEGFLQAVQSSAGRMKTVMEGILAREEVTS